MSPSLDELVSQGEGEQDPVDLGDGIFMSRNIAWRTRQLTQTH